VIVFAISLFVFGDEGWRNVISSGVFRLQEKEFDPDHHVTAEATRPNSFL
jgi:hypothetical protein